MELHETELSSTAERRRDSTSSPVLQKRRRDIVTARGIRIVLGLERMGYINSAKPRLLIVAGGLLAADAGRMILAGLASENRRLFDLSGTVGLRP